MILDRKKLLFEVEMSTMDGEGGKRKGGIPFIAITNGA